MMMRRTHCGGELPGNVQTAVAGRSGRTQTIRMILVVTNTEAIT